MHSKNIIIGSGPAGVSAASEILKNNKDLLILDVGSEIEEEKKMLLILSLLELFQLRLMHCKKWLENYLTILVPQLKQFYQSKGV